MPILQTNSLYHLGEYIVINVGSPVIPEATLVLGYYVHTDDIIDQGNSVAGQYAIIPISQYPLEQNQIVWKALIKVSKENNFDVDFSADCNAQVEGYYIFFKFTKIYEDNLVVNIDKISLQLTNKPNEDGTYGEAITYPYYARSLFSSKDRLYSTNHTNWAFNVLNKLKGIGILPTFIIKDRDFDVFWGWLTHWYSLLVNFSRQFLDFSSDLELFSEYLKQKGYYKHSKASIYENIVTIGNGIILEKFYDNTICSSITGITSYNAEYVSTSFIATLNKTKFIFNQNILNLNSYTKVATLIYCLYDKNFNYLSGAVTSMPVNILTPGEITIDNELVAYIRICNKKGVNCFLKIERYGESFNTISMKSKEDLFSVYNIFSKRGTLYSKSIVSTLLEATPLDNLYCEYLNKNNSAWFLGKYSPSNRDFVSPIILDTLKVKSTEVIPSGSIYHKFEDNKFVLNNCCSIVLNNMLYTSAILSLIFYDEDGNMQSQVGITNQNNESNNGVYSWYGEGAIPIKNINTSLSQISVPLSLIRDKGLLAHNEYRSSSQFSEYEFYVRSEINGKKIKYVSVEGILCGNESQVSAISEDIFLTNDPDDSNIIRNLIVGLDLKDNVGYYLSYLLFSYTDGYSITLNYYDLTFQNGLTGKLTFKSISGVDPDIIVPFDVSLVSLNGGIGFFENEDCKVWFDFSQIPLKAGGLLFDENAVVIQETPNLQTFEAKFGLSKLPYNLNFLNPPKYYMIYGQNHSIYSDNKIQDIINQKVLPYSNYNLFITNDSISIPEIPLQITDIIITLPIINGGTGSLLVKWVGGIATYELSLFAKQILLGDVENEIEVYPTYGNVGETLGGVVITEQMVNVSTNFTPVLGDVGKYFDILRSKETIVLAEKVLTSLEGLYDIKIEDSEGQIAWKYGVSVDSPNVLKFKYKVKRYPGNIQEIGLLNSDCKYNNLSLSINGGIAPYTVKYKKRISNSPVVEEDKYLTILYPDTYCLLVDAYFPIYTTTYLWITDSGGISDYQISILDDEVLVDLNDFDSGYCLLNT